MSEVKWLIVKVPCTDGKERIGMLIDEMLEINETERILKSGLHEEYAQAIVAKVAEEHNLELFDSQNENYEADSF